MKYILCLILYCCLASLSAQTDSVYIPDFEAATILDDQVNSKAEEIIPLISHDGQTLYFSRFMHNGNVAGKLSGHDIWLSKKEGDHWQKAINVEGLNTKWSNAVVGFNTDGKSLMLFNELGKDQFGLSVAYGFDSTEMQMSESGQVNTLLKMNKVYGLSVGNSGKSLFLAIDDSSNQGYDIFLSKRLLSKWTEPIRLPVNINSSSNEHSPFLSADSILYFASDRAEGLGGYDIYASKALSSDLRNWSEPVNLGPSINSSAFDAYFSVDTSGVAYFTSNRTGGLSDIYTSKVLKNMQDEKVDTNFFEIELAEIKEALKTELKTKKRSTPHFVFFEFDSTRITDSASQKLNMFIEIINEDSLVSLELQGHADSIGTIAYNNQLSTARSASVRKYLMNHGIKDLDIKVLGFGEGVPIADNGTEKGRRKNRRVKLVLIKQ